MVRFISATLLLVSVLIAPSQVYQKFVVEGAHWKMAETGCPNGCNGGLNLYPHFDNTYWSKLEGDTIVDSFTYKKLYTSKYLDFQPAQSIHQVQASSWIYSAIVREDTLSRVVFFRGEIGTCSLPTSSDTILFDFSKQQHDTIVSSVISSNVPLDCNSQNFSADSTYSSQFNNSEAPFFNFIRKTWLMNPVDNQLMTTFYLYEGIGPSFGLFGSPGPSFEGDYHSMLISYCVGTDSSCGSGYVTGIEKITETNRTFIYPNPTSDVVNVLSEDLVSQIVITDLTGRVLRKQVVNTNNVRLDLGDLGKGEYFCKIFCGEKSFTKLVLLQ